MCCSPAVDAAACMANKFPLENNFTQLIQWLTAKVICLGPGPYLKGPLAQPTGWPYGPQGWPYHPLPSDHQMLLQHKTSGQNLLAWYHLDDFKYSFFSLFSAVSYFQDSLVLNILTGERVMWLQPKSASSEAIKLFITRAPFSLNHFTLEEQTKNFFKSQ